MSLYDHFVLKKELVKVRHMLESMLFTVRVFILFCSRQWVAI